MERDPQQSSDFPDDATLILQIQDADESALRLLIGKYGPGVKANLMADFGSFLDEDDIDSLMHEAAWRVYRSADRLDDRKGSLGGYLYVAAKRACIDFWRGELRGRKKDRTVRVTITEDQFCQSRRDGKMVVMARTPDDPARSARRSAQIRAAIDKLPHNQREIIMADILARGDGREVACSRTLAERLGSSPNAIVVSRHKARKNLAKLLKDSGILRKETSKQ